MRVLVIVNRDNGCRMYHTVNSMKAVGIEVEGYCMKSNHGNYPFSLPVAEFGQLIDRLGFADVVWFGMGNVNLYKRLKPFILPFSKVIVTHSGSQYRQRPKGRNKVFKRATHVGLTEDLVQLSKPEKTVYGGIRPVDTDLLLPNYHSTKPIKIGHFPSDPMKKGTKEIMEVLDGLEQEGFQFENVSSTARVDWESNIKRMRECDIVIDQLKLKQGSQEMGVIGGQAYEAAALGCIVISNLLRIDYYLDRYKDLGIYIVNSKKILISWLSYMLRQDKKELIRLQTDTRKWIETKHSYEAQGKEIIKILEEL